MHHDDHDDFDLYDDSFDEKTFQLELQVADPERREAAWRTLVVMQRLARLRAREQNITFDAAWRDIFDVDRLRGEMIGSDQKRSDLAHRVWNSLDHLGELRCERRRLLPTPKWARTSSWLQTATRPRPESSVSAEATLREVWRARFDEQATPSLLDKVHRATGARMRTYAGRRHHVTAEDIDDMMMGVITDTLDGTLAWDHERKPLLQHLLDAVKYRARDDARRRWRNRVRIEELDEETTDVSVGEQLVAGAAPQRPDEAYRVRRIADGIVDDVRRAVAGDPEVTALLDAIITRRAFERVDIMMVTGFSAATYKNARRRLDRTLVELPPGTRDAVMAVFTN